MRTDDLEAGFSFAGLVVAVLIAALFGAAIGYEYRDWLRREREMWREVGIQECRAGVAYACRDGAGGKR